MKGMVALSLAALGLYLLYSSPSANWSNFGDLCVPSLGCTDPIAVALGAAALIMAAVV